jgi:hypothetical protein
MAGIFSPLNHSKSTEVRNDSISPVTARETTARKRSVLCPMDH